MVKNVVNIYSIQLLMVPCNNTNTCTYVNGQQCRLNVARLVVHNGDRMFMVTLQIKMVASYEP